MNCDLFCQKLWIQSSANILLKLIQIADLFL